MSERPEFIQLEEGDDVSSVKDRLSFHHRKQVLLIWPESGRVLSRKLDLVLIQRDAIRRGIRLALVTHDPKVVQHAGELNISTFETIGASERHRWKRGRSGVFSKRFWRPRKDTPDPEELMPVASRVRGEESETSALRRWGLRFVVTLIVIVLLAAVALIFLPGATVTLQPAQEETSVSVDITAKLDAPAVDIENGIIPATLLSVTIEETGTIPTSGVQQLADIPAQGSVIFVNQTASSINIPAGTTVSTSAGTPIQFRTLENASLPGGVGQQLEVPVEALPGSAGSIGNVESGLINTVADNLSDRLTVRNVNPTYGGSSRTLGAVTQDDYDRLQATVRQQLQARAFLEMQPRLDPSQFLILETVRIAEERSDWTKFSAQVGDAADTLTLTMQAVVEATAVNEQFGQQIAFTRLAHQIPEGRVILPDSIEYQRGPVTNVFQNGQVNFTLGAQGLVVAQIDPAALQDRLAGHSLDEALTVLLRELDLEEGSTPQIQISPEWFGRMPLLPFRIRVVLENPGA